MTDFSAKSIEKLVSFICCMSISYQLSGTGCGCNREGEGGGEGVKEVSFRGCVRGSGIGGEEE